MPYNRYLAACVQLRCTSDISRNLNVAEELIRRAANLGARFVATPENTTFLGPHSRKLEVAEPIDGPTHQRFANLAAETGVTLLIGSVAEQAPEHPGRVYNTSLLFSPQGELLATSRKIHLFDVDIPGGTRFRESDTCVPGDTAMTANTLVGHVGLSICYDVRFPELYRALCDQGAQVLCVPAAFTLMTGKDHWHALLRARAIENGCYVVAPAQWGTHDDQALRQSYGHSVIIDPWGTIVAEASDGEGICLAEIELDRVDRVRRSIPVHQHRRM